MGGANLRVAATTRPRPRDQAVGNMAEWLRRQTRNLVGIALVGSNPAVVELPRSFCYLIFMPMPKNLRHGIQEGPVKWRRSYYAGVSSDRTNLSPFTKDYRGLALSCDFDVFVAREGAINRKRKKNLL